MEDELDDAGAVAQVDEDQAAVVAAAVDPAGDPRLGVDPVAAAPGRTRCRGSRSARSGRRRSAHRARPPVISSTRLAGVDRRAARRSPCRAAARVPSASRISDAAGADPVGVLELALEAAPGEVDLGREPGVAQLDRQRHRPLAAGPSSAIATKASRPAASLLLVERQQDPLDPGRPADRRRRRPAELLDQAVVAAAAADLRLGAERVADEGEDRPRVVVEAADQGRVDLVGDPGRVEQRPHLGEVLGVLALERARRSSARSPSPPRVPSSSESKARSGLMSIRSRTSSESSPSCACRCAFSSSR